MVDLVRYMKAGQKVLLVGPPGIGKTARIFAAAEEDNREVVVMRASLSERVDFGGALIPDAENGVTKALPLETLKYLQDTDNKVLLFLDDLGQAPMDVQAACMKLFDADALGPNVLIWGATNRPGDKAGVSALCEPLRSRFDLAFGISTPNSKLTDNSHILLSSWKDEVEAWCEWALEQRANPAVVAWHRSTTGRTLYQWQSSADPAQRFPDFRSWHTVIRLMGEGITDYHSLAATIGAPAASEFGAFADLAEKVPTPKEIIKNPSKVTIPEEPSALWLVATALAAHIDVKEAGPFITYIERMPRVFAALAARDSYKRLGSALAMEKEWKDWLVDNQDMFN